MGLTSDAIDSYIMGRLDDGSAKSSVNRVLQLLKQSYTLAKLPAPEVRRLDERDNVRTGFFSEGEIRRVMANLPGDLADFTLFGWLTGMRKNEIASLRWEDVDGECIRLRAENAKNGTARLIPFEGELGELMERRKAARQVEANGTVILSALIFHCEGEPIRDFRKSWATACRKAGINRLFHDLRRSAVRNMIAAGVPQNVAMKISGHKTDSMFRRYAIVSETDLRKALARYSAAQRRHERDRDRYGSQGLVFSGTRTKHGQNTKGTRNGCPKLLKEWPTGSQWLCRTSGLHCHVPRGRSDGLAEGWRGKGLRRDGDCRCAGGSVGRFAADTW